MIVTERLTWTGPWPGIVRCGFWSAGPEMLCQFDASTSKLSHL